ncbi:MAG: aminopeptidase N [Myxococcota bacterium]
MTDPQPRPTYRSDYRPPPYWIDSVDLHFDLHADHTRVRARMALRRNADAAAPGAPLVLDGEELELRSLSVAGQTVDFALSESVEVEPEQLTLRSLPDGSPLPDEFVVETEVEIHPESNTQLSGLYQSSGNFCTQCEAEGFRRITWFLDRPDVMARYRTTIEADRAQVPVLLSNGNRIEESDAGDGRHRVVWEDPFPKPSYLFAMVAGDLRCHEGLFTTKSGRPVKLEIWVEPQNVDACEHALESLKRAMKWDEEVFGLEYDLDVYMIVAVGDFNMGAMENKGLNVFNSKYVLARPETATDADYEAIEAVIAHEYFHNWTGNRVTCRDWFQLTLKEGLTVYRDQRFTADMTSEAVKRIDDVRTLRAAQFPEDAGPMAHPIRPESYISMDNFYTATVYEKGAEVVRLYDTLLGRDGFRRGMDLYFERHDGQAVTCDDFRAAMADANGADLAQFERWYEQPGTPVLEAEGEYDGRARRFALTLRQKPPEAHAEEDFLPMHMPVSVGLVGSDGRDLASDVLELRGEEERFEFDGIEERPVVSLLRGFSAPVQVRMERPREELAFLMGHDGDAFNRWDAGQTLAQELILEMAGAHSAGRALELDPLFVDAFRRLLLDPDLDGSLKALALALPSEKVLAQAMEEVDVEGLQAARRFTIRELARTLEAELRDVFEATRPDGPYRADRASIHRRRLHNAVLRILTAPGSAEAIALAEARFQEADNMTDSQAALSALADHAAPESARALEVFYQRWKHDPLVIDKWFQTQAMCDRDDAVEVVLGLARHPDFTTRNPNRVRSLVGAFGSGNLLHFHRRDGAGYTFLADQVVTLDPLNPQVAARMVSLFNQWRRFDAARRELMRAELQRIGAVEGLSKDTGEIVGKALNQPD